MSVEFAKTSGDAAMRGSHRSPERQPPGREAAPILASGRAIGGKIATGVGHFVSSPKDLDAFRAGEILMADATLPEWETVMASASAIVTNRGGPSSHAAAMARKLGVPAVVGTVDGASRLWDGATLTVWCAGGGVGRVYEGVPPSDIAVAVAVAGSLPPQD